MKYKMVVTDLDGTLLDDQKIISQENISVLKKLDVKGVKIVVATGRNYFMAKHLAEGISFLRPVILANNGSVVRCSFDDKLMTRNCLNPISFDKIYECGLKYGLHPMLHVDEYEQGYDMMYDAEEFGVAYLGNKDLFNVRARCLPFTRENTQHILSVCYRGMYDELSGFIDETKTFNNGSFNFILNGNIGRKLLIEYLHVDGCKWRSLNKYLHSVGILPSEVVALGDDNNDVELLANVGMGIAMKNGTEQCRKAGKVVSEYDNNDSGVGRELSKLFEIE